MANIPPIDDNYIDDIIKSTGPYNVGITTTQGVKLRELVKKLRDYFEQQIQQGFSEAKFANNAERDAYNVTSLPFQAFVTDDGDGKWALYRATSTGVGASYIKISDTDLLNVAMSSGAVKIAYESNPDTNAFTDAYKSVLDHLTDSSILLNNETLYDKRTTQNQIPINSIFLGNQAGYNADNASNSNFLGRSAGFYASTAFNSNFFGNQAGVSALNASNSNFFGYMAGSEALNASNSNFFGSGAGTNAVNASNSNFFGGGAGNGSPKASYSNLFGYNVGINGIGTNNIIIGKNITLPRDTINAINLGGILFATGTFAGDNAVSSVPVDGGKIGIGILTPTEALDVNGNIKIRNLSGTGDRAVLAAPDGTLKVGGNTTIPTFRQVTSSSYEFVDNSSDGFYLGTMQPGHPFVHFSCGGINPDNNVVIPCSIQGSVMGKGGGSTLALQPYVADYPGAGVAIGLGTANATESLDVSGNIKSRALAGSGDRLVITDETGKLKEGYPVSKIAQYSDMTLDNVLSNENGSYQTIVLGDFKGIYLGTALTIGVPNAQSSGDQPAIISAIYGIDSLPGPINVMSSKFHLRGGDLVVAALSGTGDRPVLADPDGKLKIGESTALPSNITKATLGLDKVDNTSDVDKPVSRATQAALDLKADFLLRLSNDTFYDKRTVLTEIPKDSNFIGKDAGNGATLNTYEVNFFGNGAGNGATGAFGSNFFGKNAGYKAVNAFNGNFFGLHAGYEATDALGANFFGTNAGAKATKANNANFLGVGTGFNATNAGNSNFFGSDAGSEATNASDASFFGVRAGIEAKEANHSNFFGYEAGFRATNASNSNFFGNSAGYYASGANNSNFFGNSAGKSSPSASYSNLFGYNVGSGGIGANNIIIGTNISLPNATTNAMNLGGILFGTGTHSTVSDSPSFVPANGKIGINKVNPTSALDVVGIPEYADNTAALAASLTNGAFYRTGDVLKVVH